MKKIVSIVFTIIISISFSGCYNYRDINKVLFVTTVIMDIDEENNPIVYDEAFKANAGNKGPGSDTRLVFKGEGKTLFEGARDMSLMASYKLNYTQNKVLVFTKRAAEYGLDNFIDFFERDQELIIRPSICIYDGDPEKLLQAKLEEEKYIGVYIMQLIENIRVSSRSIRMSFNNYLNQRLIGDKTNVIPIIQLNSDGLGSKIKIEGGAVIKEDKLVNVIKKEEAQGFNFLLDNVKLGTLEPKNPEVKSKFVTLEILSSKTITDLKYDEGKIKLIKKINVNTSLAEIQDKMSVNDKNLMELKSTTEDNIRRACETIFNKYKEIGLDIFDISEQFQMRYPKENIENVIKETELIVDVNVDITTSGENLSFIKE
ncbi:Ger(x)C family spore germination protein [Clostridium sp. MB40-C1]|uniref:Ger(x)C family spore germination protein n=1 Tax=Clostridium sp. MB40-C1 TaxID=3070996 RepID=UPI0027E046F3|nr:Ger(x)C family spore germination protein [Clostridium sp. MB40-C1]WMJ82336.1 Ger(x)C family spore germination protein [Clostridium sp. MB40-C1]